MIGRFEMQVIGNQGEMLDKPYILSLKVHRVWMGSGLQKVGLRDRRRHTILDVGLSQMISRSRQTEGEKKLGQTWHRTGLEANGK